MTQSTSLARAVSEARAFTRFYTSFVGALSDRLHRAEYTLPQSRVIHEIATGPKDTPAADMARALRMDAGQLSRVLTSLEEAGLITRTPSEHNAKQLNIALTEEGEAAFRQLDGNSSEEMGARLAGLTEEDRTRLVRALRLVTRLLGRTPHPAADLILREPEPGDLGWVVWRQSQLYAGEYGWNGDYEALVLRILADFAETRDPARERGWIAEADGERLGAVFCVRGDDTTAKLRLLHVEQAARGLGLGRRLVAECMTFAKAAGYTRMELWTNDVLRSARRIYIHAGFQLVDEAEHVSFGHRLNGQTWAREL